MTAWRAQRAGEEPRRQSHSHGEDVHTKEGGRRSLPLAMCGHSHGEGVHTAMGGRARVGGCCREGYKAIKSGCGSIVSEQNATREGEGERLRLSTGQSRSKASGIEHGLLIEDATPWSSPPPAAPAEGVPPMPPAIPSLISLRVLSLSPSSLSVSCERK